MIALVDKLNKGTSRDQWGALQYWGFKTPDGLIRTRVSHDGALEVKHFDPAKVPSYRKTIDWRDAHFLGSCYIEITDEDKGPSSKEMIAEVNALIEGYNDAHAKWIGKQVVGGATLAATEKIAIVVENVAVEFDKDANLSTRLSGKQIGKGYGNHRILAENARELEADDYAGDLARAIDAEKAKIRKGNEFIQKALYAAERGKSMTEVGYGGVGAISTTEANNIVRLVNALATDKVEQPA